MSAFTAISSMIELAVIIFLIYGFYKEDYERKETKRQ